MRIYSLKQQQKWISEAQRSRIKKFLLSFTCIYIMQKDQSQNAQIPEPQASKQPQKVEVKPEEQQIAELEEEIPDHFYDSDLASVNEKDFLSDNQPPKDHIQQRKLLYKEKMLHVFKTIVRIGEEINKPAKFDRISLTYKQVPSQQVVPRPLKKKDGEQIYEHPAYFSTMYLMDHEQIEYNLGKDHFNIQRLVISMKKGETAIFQLQNLQKSKKSNLKIRTNVQVFVISVREWTTVIDLDCDGRFMKQVVCKGEGHSRISKHDEVSYEFTLKQGDRVAIQKKYAQPVKLQADYLDELPNVLWKILNSMKVKQSVKLIISDEVMRQFQGDKYQKLIGPEEVTSQQNWTLLIEIFFFHSIDDVYLDGRLLKKLLIKGVSTARPDHSSLAYYALRFLGKNKEVLFEDNCFQSDWWQDLGKLDQLGCRKSYLDDNSVSHMLRDTIQRMKPAQVAEIECRDKALFTYGDDYMYYCKLIGNQQLPEVVFLVVRLYNFSEGKNCFNMELDQKISEARRKKAIAIDRLHKGQYVKAKQVFQNILSFFSTGKINQDAYDQKISALMNCTLCLLKTQQYAQMIPVCNQILELPRHGYDPDKMKIRGPGHAKIEGKLPQQAKGSQNQREAAEMVQSKKILDKCLYRKALALTKIGEGAQALDCLNKMQTMSEQATQLVKQAEKIKERYEKKTVKMFKNMFG